MLMDLVAPLKEGESVPLTLTFADKAGRKSTQEITAPVRALAAAGRRQALTAMPARRHASSRTPAVRCTIVDRGCAMVQGTMEIALTRHRQRGSIGPAT